MTKVMRLRKPGGLNNIYLSTQEDRAPQGGEVRIRVRASSLNFSDYYVAIGENPVADGRIPLCDGAGEVVEVGPEVRQFAVGDTVMSLFYPFWQDGGPGDRYRAPMTGNGLDGYAREYVVEHENSITRVPNGWTAQEAATLPCAGLTAWRALFVDSSVKPGDVVLTQGTGGVSIIALQFAKAAGAKVIATSSSPDKLERLKTLGADHVINYREIPEWGRAAFEITGKRGVDHVIEVGGSGTFEQSLVATRVGGHIAVIGVLASAVAPVNSRLIMRKSAHVVGLTVGNRRQQIDMVRGLEAVGIKPVIDRCFPLEELAEAFRYQESNRQFGKIGITI